MRLTVWTAAYSPFMMGGNVNAPIKTEVEAGDKFDIGKGFEAYLVVSPKGKTHVVEAKTGAFVGTTIDEVKADICAGDMKVMRKQIKAAREEFKKAIPLTNDEFWGRFR